MNTDQPNLMKMLCSTRFAEGLPNNHLQCLCRAARVFSLPSGATLFREGVREDDVFVIRSGYVRLSMNVPHRGDVAFLTAGPGDLVGWSGPQHKKVSGTVFCAFWSSFCACGDLAAELCGRCGGPCLVPERQAPVDAATDGRKFSVDLW